MSFDPNGLITKLIIFFMNSWNKVFPLIAYLDILVSAIVTSTLCFVVFSNCLLSTVSCVRSEEVYRIKSKCSL